MSEKLKQFIKQSYTAGWDMSGWDTYFQPSSIFECRGSQNIPLIKFIPCILLFINFKPCTSEIYRQIYDSYNWMMTVSDSK